MSEHLRYCAYCKHGKRIGEREYLCKLSNMTFSMDKYGFPLHCKNYKEDIMKEFWKDYRFWVAVVAVVLAIVAVVLYFTVPVFCYAVSGFLIGGLICFIIGFYVAKKKFYLPTSK